MSNDLISIITPVYNTGLFLERCLNSIINQSYTNWELILVNDGSTDNSRDICYSFAQKDNRIIYLEQSNQGQAVARNKALDIIKGKYICFVDSDDWIDPNFIKYLYEAIDNNSAQIAMCAHCITDNKRNEIVYVPTVLDILSCGDFKNKLIKDEIRSYLCDKIFIKNIFDDIRFTPGIFYEDYHFYNKILSYIKSNIPVVNKPLYFYYQRFSSTVHTRNLKHIIDFYKTTISRFELDFLNNDEKAYVLKRIMVAYLQLSNLDEYDRKIISECKKYIMSIDKLTYSKALTILKNSKLKKYIYFLLAFHFPLFYRIILKSYMFFKSKF